MNTILIIDQLGEDDILFLNVEELDLSHLKDVYINMEPPEDGSISREVWEARQQDVWTLLEQENTGYIRDDLLREFPVKSVTPETIVITVGIVP